MNEREQIVLSCDFDFNVDKVGAKSCELTASLHMVKAEPALR